MEFINRIRTNRRIRTNIQSNLSFEKVLFTKLKPGKYYIEYKHGGEIYEYIDYFIEFDGYEAIFNDITCYCYENWRFYKLISKKDIIQKNMERRAFQKVMLKMNLTINDNFVSFL